MGLKAKDMQLHLCRVLQVSAEISYTFIQRHPLVSGALLVFIILYIFLSYIYNFLVYMSPFLVCTAIFVTIFWSSEQNLLMYVNKDEKKREEERVEPKYPKIQRRELLYKYPSQNATSRRRNFTGRKLDVYGGLEEKAKDLSSVFRNEFTKKNTWIKEAKYINREEGSLDYELSEEAPTKQMLYSEPSMRDLVIYGAEIGGPEEEIEKKKDEKEAQDDRKKDMELKEDDQKNLMDLGLTEMERNKRLESLIARRRARKFLKLHIENGLIDSVIPREIAPLFIARANPFDSPKEFEGIDGIEMPGSAPSALRSPFDIPYDPNEEKPNLKGDSFDEEFTSNQKDMQFCRRESFHCFPLEPRHDLAYPRVRRFPGKGNHDWLEQLTSKEGNESESKAPTSLSEREETKHEEDGKSKTETTGVKDEELENAHATKSMSDQTSEPDLTTQITNVESAKVLEKPRPTIPKPHERVLNFPMFSTNATNMNDSFYESIPSPVDKNKENMLFTGRRISHTPSYSIASDLQVEVSEAGSPTLTIDESHETNTTTDGESVVYDGDIDRDITSGSEDMWGASLHSRGVRGISEHDISELNNWRDFGSPLASQNIDEENAADVSSMSSRSDMPDDTPTHAISSDRKIFGNVKDFVGETDAHNPSHSSDVSTRWKRLMRLMDKSVNHSPHETHSEKPEEWSNLSENLINKEQVINDVNNSAIIEQDNTHNSKSNEDNTSVVQQETTDEVSINSSSSSSPRSVLPQNTIADEVSSSAYNQEMHLGVQQSNMDENSEENFSPLNRQDATAEPSKQVEMMISDDMNENSRELFDNKVPLNSVMLELSSEVQRENEDKSQTSMRQEATKEPFINSEAMETTSSKHVEGEQNDLNKNEAILSPSHSTEEVNYLQSESKQVVEDHMEKEKLDRVDISEDSQLPMVTEVTNAEEELNKNETMVLSESGGESVEVSNIAHMKEPEQVLQHEDVSAPKPNDSSKEI